MKELIKKNNYLKLREFGITVVAIIYLPVYFLGLMLYFFSKFLRGLSYLLTIDYNSARTEFNNFWSRELDLGDIFKN